jgi:hypothetical protein
MNRIILGIAESLLSHLGCFGLTRRGTRRITSDSKAGRQMISKQGRSRSKHMAHIGAKEHERAARCYMQSYFPMKPEQYATDPLRLRAAPTMEVISKRSFYNIPF